MRIFGALTFGCDGAKAAAPIAKARTAFILTQISSQLRLEPAELWLPPYFSRPPNFKHLANVDPRERA